MASISFEALYDSDGDRAYEVLMLWLDGVLAGMGATVVIDRAKARLFLAELAEVKKTGFPANGGYDAASPFKKASVLYVYLHQESCNPFVITLPFLASGEPAYSAGPSPLGNSSGIASVVGFALVQACLDGAEIMKSGKYVKLEKRIDVSSHFMTDLVEASQDITPTTHFKVFSLLFESLAYQTNEKITYDRKFDQEVIIDRPSWY